MGDGGKEPLQNDSYDTGEDFIGETLDVALPAPSPRNDSQDSQREGAAEWSTESRQSADDCESAGQRSSDEQTSPLIQGNKSSRKPEPRTPPDIKLENGLLQKLQPWHVAVAALLLLLAAVPTVLSAVRGGAGSGCCTAEEPECVACQAFERESACRAESQLRKHGSDDRESCIGGPCFVEQGILYPGGELASWKDVVSSAECCAKCRAVQRCIAWSWEVTSVNQFGIPQSSVCHLKRPAKLERLLSPNFVSGLPFSGVEIIEKMGRPQFHAGDVGIKEPDPLIPMAHLQEHLAADFTPAMPAPVVVPPVPSVSPREPTTVTTTVILTTTRNPYAEQCTADKRCPLKCSQPGGACAIVNPQGDFIGAAGNCAGAECGNYCERCLECTGCCCL